MTGFSRISPSPLLPRSSRGPDHFICALGAQFSLSPFSRLFGGRGRLRGMHSSASPISPVLWIQARHTDSEAGSPSLLPATNRFPPSSAQSHSHKSCPLLHGRCSAVPLFSSSQAAYKLDPTRGKHSSCLALPHPHGDTQEAVEVPGKSHERVQVDGV